MPRREHSAFAGDGDTPVPPPRLHPRKRLALLEEIAADVDALEDELAARGVPRRRARAAAMDRLYPGATAVRELEVEAVLYRRLAERFGGDQLAVIERVALTVVSLLTIVALAKAVRPLDGLLTRGVFLWFTIAAIAAMVANTARVAFALWIRQDLSAAQRRQAHRVQVGLVLVAVAVAAGGASLEAYLAMGLLESGSGGVNGFSLLRGVMLLVAMGLGAGIVGSLGWLTLTPSLRSYDTFERRIASLFVPIGPRPVREEDRPLSGLPGSTRPGVALSPDRHGGITP